MTGWQKKQQRKIECAQTRPKIEIRKIRPTLARKFCRLIQKCLRKSPINSIRFVLFATANMPVGPLASTKRKIFTQSAKCKLCFSCLQSDHTIKNVQLLDLIATALTMRSFTDPKECTPQKTQQSHQQK